MSEDRGTETMFHIDLQKSWHLTAPLSALSFLWITLVVTHLTCSAMASASNFPFQHHLQVLQVWWRAGPSAGVWGSGTEKQRSVALSELFHSAPHGVWSNHAPQSGCFGAPSSPASSTQCLGLRRVLKFGCQHLLARRGTNRRLSSRPIQNTQGRVSCKGGFQMSWRSWPIWPPASIGGWERVEHHSTDFSPLFLCVLRRCNLTLKPHLWILLLPPNSCCRD